jgi:hypothetical protein
MPGGGTDRDGEGRRGTWGVAMARKWAGRKHGDAIRKNVDGIGDEIRKVRRRSICCSGARRARFAR